jgi:hypothetical protein
MTRLTIPLLLATALLAGCNSLGPREKATVKGGAIGAAAGAGVSAISGGDPVTGAVVGGAAGAVIGNVHERNKKK